MRPIIILFAGIFIIELIAILIAGFGYGWALLFVIVISFLFGRRMEKYIEDHK